jgi:hypothetical protein
MGDGSGMEKRRQWRAPHGGLDSATVMDIADVKGDAMAMERCNGNGQCNGEGRCDGAGHRNSDGDVRLVTKSNRPVVILAGALSYGTVTFQKKLVSNFFVPLSTTYLSYLSSVH